MSDFRTGRHVVHKLNVHLVFVTKYRRGAISNRVMTELRPVLASVCSDFGASLNEFDGEDDHVHLLVSYPPQVALSKLVNSLKGVSAYRIRELDLPEVKSRLWGNHFWSPSYCAVSCGGAPLDVVAAYIQEQRLPPRKRGEKRKPLTPT